MFEDEFNRIQAVVERLVREANAKVVFIVDENGHLLIANGDLNDIETMSADSRRDMVSFLDGQPFAVQFHEREKANLYLHVVTDRMILGAERVILGLIFDADSSLGLVRLRAKAATEKLNVIFDSFDKRQ